MLESLKVGYDEGGGERLSRSYAYNSFSDITALAEDRRRTHDAYGSTYSFAPLTGCWGHLAMADQPPSTSYGRSYSYDFAPEGKEPPICWTLGNGQTASRLPSTACRTGDAIVGFWPGVTTRRPHTARQQADRFDYDANGNMTVRNKGLSNQQTLVWDARTGCRRCRTTTATWSSVTGTTFDGARVKKTSGTTTTYTFFAHYEEEVTGGVTTTVSYTTASAGCALRSSAAAMHLYHLHGDHLGSASLTTSGSAETASRTYYAYGAERSRDERPSDRPHLHGSEVRRQRPDVLQRPLLRPRAGDVHLAGYDRP